VKRMGRGVFAMIAAGCAHAKERGSESSGKNQNRGYDLKLS